MAECYKTIEYPDRKAIAALYAAGAKAGQIAKEIGVAPRTIYAELKRGREGDKLDLGGHVLTPFYTPGHTIGSICVLDEVSGSLFSGDTVFVDGVGNTIHPTGSEKMLIESLKKLSNIQFKGLYPGHGPTVSDNGQKYVANGLRMMGA